MVRISMMIAASDVIIDVIRESRSAQGRRPSRCLAFHRCCTIHLLDMGPDIEMVQGLLVPKDVGTTIIYTDVLNRGGHGVGGPADRLSRRVVSCQYCVLKGG